MIELEEKIGMTFEPFTFTIERGKIREFAMAIGDQNPIYYDIKVAQKEGFRDIPIPPTFPTVIEMWGGADFDTLIQLLHLNPLKVLHGEQKYEYLGEICAGDVITGKTSVIKAEAKKGMKLFTLQTNYTNQNTQKVLVSLSVIIERQ